MNLFLQTQYYLSKSSKMSLALLMSLYLAEVSYAEPISKTLSFSVNNALRENITGTVKDDKGEPLPGVTVKIKGSATATTTDVNGVFRLNLPTGNETLVFSFIGFENKEVAAQGRTTLDVILVESSNQLDQVVVTGYGTKKRSEIVGSVATITGEELQDVPGPNVAAALRGRIAGVGVSQVSGKPGASVNLNIRNASISSNSPSGATSEPLYIIDGISMPNSDAFDNLDASMIESLTILKDASAAIYGASGAKGVVLVTTKRGKAGKPTISYNGYLGVSDAASKPDMMSAYEHGLLLNEGARLGNRPNSDIFTASDLEYLKTLNNKSWYDQLWSAATMQRHNLSLSGGSDKITFFVGGSYQNENGNYKGLQVDKYTLRSGMNATILPGLKADLAFNIDQNINKSQNNGTENDADFFRMIVTAPLWRPLEIDGKPVDLGGNTVNPLALLNSGYYDDRSSAGYRINASLSYAPEFVKGLTAKLQISQAGSSGKTRLYRAPYDVYTYPTFGTNSRFYNNTPAAGTPRAFVSLTNAETRAGQTVGDNYQGFFTLQYAKTLGAHTFNAIAGGEQTVNYSETQQNIWLGQMVPGVDDPWAYDVNRTSQPTRSVSESTKRSFFGRFSYDFNKKYLIEGVGRLDASSNFATGNRWGFSPSIGAGWIVSSENFFKDNINFINFFKLKANWGIVGDDRVGQRLWQERYLVALTEGYLFGTNNSIGLNPSIIPNPNITWEKKQTFNVGFEASLFNNKLDLGVEVFRNFTFDGFDGNLDRIYPMYGGFKSAIVNYREVYNWGSEFSVGYKAKLMKDLNLSTNVNFSFGNSVVSREIYNSTLLPINIGEDIITVGLDPRIYSSSNIGLISKGMLRTPAEVDAFLQQNPNYNFKGAVPEVGWLVYEDMNKDGIVNESDMVPMFDHPNPFLSTGINLGLSYKGLNLSTSISARLGGKVFYDSRAVTSASQTNNVLTIWKDRWTAENPSGGRMPRYDDPSVSVNSTFWAVNGTMIRVNNMTLSYKIPERFTKTAGLSNARILATGNNLWNIVNPLPYKDPYTSSAYDYPTIRTISLGLSVGF